MAIRVVLLVKDNNDLATLVTLIDGFANLVEACPVPDTAPKSRWAGGIAKKDMRGDALALAFLADGSRSDDQIKREFEAHKFAPSSALSVLSTLKRTGRVRRQPYTNRWELVPQQDQLQLVKTGK